MELVQSKKVSEALCDNLHVVLIDELVPYGGLGSRVKAIAWDIKANCRLDTFSLDDAALATALITRLSGCHPDAKMSKYQACPAYSRRCHQGPTGWRLFLDNSQYL
jgi:hypothetical protein